MKYKNSFNVVFTLHLPRHYDDYGDFVKGKVLKFSFEHVSLEWIKKVKGEFPFLKCKTSPADRYSSPRKAITFFKNMRDIYKLLYWEAYNGVLRREQLKIKSPKDVDINSRQCVWWELIYAKNVTIYEGTATEEEWDKFFKLLELREKQKKLNERRKRQKGLLSEKIFWNTFNLHKENTNAL